MVYKVLNNSKLDSKISFKGHSYEVDAGKEVSNIPEEVAMFWTSIHNFLTLTKDTVKKVEEIVEEIIDEELIEEVGEVEEIVAKKTSKK